MPWNKLVNAANKAEVSAKIQGNNHLNQWCPKRKCFLKMSLNFRDDQTDKKTLQTKNKTNQTKQRSKAGKSSDKTRREKKKNSCQRRCTRPGGSPAAATGANAQALEGQKKKQNKGLKEEISQATYWNYNKKGHYFTDCTKPAKVKDWLQFQ